MAALLEDLGIIAEEHEEVFDTDVRERLSEAAERLVIRREPGYRVPEDLGMFSDEGNRRLRETLESDFERLNQVFDVFELDTEAKRRASFYNPKVRSDEDGYSVDDFFGHP